MARPSLVRFVRGAAAPALLLLGAAVLLPGCRSVTQAYADTVLRGDTITYDQYQSQLIGPGTTATADSVIADLGRPATTFDKDGVRRRVDYHVVDETGELKHAEFHFDTGERLVSKELW